MAVAKYNDIIVAVALLWMTSEHAAGCLTLLLHTVSLNCAHNSPSFRLLFFILVQGNSLCMSDPNQNPFAAYSAAAAKARPAAPAPVAGASAPAAAVANPGGFGGASLEWGGNENDPNSKTVRLRDRLNEADTERRKDEEAALRRERASEIRREERMRKIKYMADMPDNQPAGTGTLRS